MVGERMAYWTFEVRCRYVCVGRAKRVDVVDFGLNDVEIKPDTRDMRIANSFISWGFLWLFPAAIACIQAASLETRDIDAKIREAAN